MLICFQLGNVILSPADLGAGPVCSAFAEVAGGWCFSTSVSFLLCRDVALSITIYTT